MIDMLINVYLPHFFDWLIETSLMASILVGFILCIKILFRNKLTPRWQYMLWIVLMIRLLLPWSPDSSSIISFAVCGELDQSTFIISNSASDILGN